MLTKKVWQITFIAAVLTGGLIAILIYNAICNLQTTDTIKGLILIGIGILCLGIRKLFFKNSAYTYKQYANNNKHYTDNFISGKKERKNTYN